MGKWVFLEKQADRSATGDAFRNSFEGEDIVVTLARESIQNSVDAHITTLPLRLKYSLRRNLDLSAVLNETFCSHATASGTPTNLSPNSASALFVEDFGTTGLTGSMADLDSNFYRLMGQLGGSEKTGGTGGSFGYGKAACILNSGCWTVLAYTVTKSGSALFGTTYMDQHKRSGRSYTGLGWYCASNSDSEGSHPYELTDDDADDLALQLGFPRAAGKEYGTSLMIVEPSIDLTELKLAIERFWWPRIIDHNLDVEIIEGGQTIKPSPTSNKELKDFVRMYEIILRKDNPATDAKRAVLTQGKRQLGIMAMQFVNVPTDLDDDARLTNVGSVALMRDQRMIVEYYRWNQGPRSDLVGVFVADKTINDDLRRTESPKHDVWSPKATRATEEQKDRAKTVLEAIRKEYRQYLKSYSPPPSDDAIELTELRRFFGTLLSTKGKTGPGASESEPIEISHKEAHIIPASGGLTLTGSATVRWKGKVAATLALGAAVKIAESDVSMSGDSIFTSIEFNGEQAKGTEPRILAEFQPGEAAKLTFKSEPYDQDWTATVTFSAAEVGNEN